MAKHWIDDWNPEDEVFWRRAGRGIARRNLVFSIFSEHLGFSVWLMWSAVVVFLPRAGYSFSADQLFWLVALPNLVGSTLRIPYTAAVARFGGRNWTIVSTAALLGPVALLYYCLSSAGTPYWIFLVAAAAAGVGGGNFASSMANISYFYPDRDKGSALGINAAGGNIGVAVVQIVVPLVIGAGAILYHVALVYLVPIVAAIACAWLFMDNLTAARASVREQLTVLRDKHAWVMSVLYIGTFGSFIGYSAAFPLLIKSQFAGAQGQYVAFLGPLVGSLSRPIGGWLSDRVGGARVTALTFMVMAAGTGGVLLSLTVGNFGSFLAAFLVLFIASGVGNGSTYRMIPAIYRALASNQAGSGQAAVRAPVQAAAVIGLASAIGAFGGFLIPRGFGMSIAYTGSITPALWTFFAAYGVFLVVTWWFYLRRVLMAWSPSLAVAQV
ncbi:MFS transporter [Rhizocola hellebori]|uniref:MFS transporter n=1 Tax=Rhizocola hellebori TaxID=1392758 RepID=A0A8J3Q5H8_9ACTN|nr:MFS transporter [Rhizocola hellebori]GIH03668.1 MFS transporter [Rhizocola hellebori]